jgi:hypothetical protein
MAYHLPAGGPPAICLLMVHVSWAPCLSPLLWYTFSNPYPFCCVLVSVPLFVLFFLHGGDQSVQRGCVFYPRVAERYCMMVNSHLFGLPNVSQALLELVASS